MEEKEIKERETEIAVKRLELEGLELDLKIRRMKEGLKQEKEGMDEEGEVMPTENSVTFKEPIEKVYTYKGRFVNPDIFKVVDDKLYFKKPHENCGGDVLITEFAGGFDHGFAKCTKCGKNVGNWISDGHNMPFRA
ncbi:MAG: hypothetical protein KAS87_06480 [Candidatus Omnitrophica bacterium]|nr:hypothetical protein [Candidatus Omnitrophota bacterium]